MTCFGTLLLAAGLMVAAVNPGLAAHANPWAEAGGTVLSKNHDDNQAGSLDTPGEDEMKGQMSRSAHGKTEQGGTGSRPGGGSASVDAGGTGDARGHGRR